MIKGAGPLTNVKQWLIMTPKEKFKKALQLPTYALLRQSCGRFGRDLCARLCARIEKSTYI